MATGNQTSKLLIVSKVLQAFFIFAVLVYAVILYAVVPSTGPGVLDDPYLVNLARWLGIVSLAALAAGYLVPWLVFKWSQPDTHMLFAAYIARDAFFIAVGVFGCVLDAFGAGWQITLPFIAASGLSLIITFPTGGRWRSFMARWEER